MRISFLIVGVMGLVAGAAASGRADDRPRFLGRIHRQKEGAPPPGAPRCIPHTDERAGFPRSLSGHLETSATAGGTGYYVGGGVPLGHGEGRLAGDGTWGWDETGSRHFRRRVILGWSQGSKYQGGTGAYHTDGPVMPDLIYATTSTVNSLGRRRGEAVRNDAAAHAVAKALRDDSMQSSISTTIGSPTMSPPRRTSGCMLQNRTARWRSRAHLTSLNKAE